MAQNRYNFTSPGAAAQDELQAYLVEQETRKRQEMLDQVAREKEAQIAQDRRTNQENVESERKFRRAATIHKTGLPGEVDAATAALLREQGFGADIAEKSVPGALQAQGETADTRDPNRTAFMMAGGEDYQQARTAAGEKASMAQAAATAKAEHDADLAAERGTRAQESADLRRELAAGAQANSKAIADSNRAVRTDAAAEKTAAATEAKTNARNSIVTAANDTLTAMDQLLTKDGKLAPGVSKIVGTMRVPEMATNIPGFGGGEAADKYAALNRLKARLVVDLMGQMKAQSRTGATGFGALSGPELTILENAIGQLNPNQSEEGFETQLVAIRDKIKKILQNPAAAEERVVPATGRGNNRDKFGY